MAITHLIYFLVYWISTTSLSSKWVVSSTWERAFVCLKRGRMEQWLSAQHSQGRFLGFKDRLCHLLGMWPWRNCLSSLSSLVNWWQEKYLSCKIAVKRSPPIRHPWYSGMHPARVSCPYCYPHTCLTHICWKAKALSLCIQEHCRSVRFYQIDQI